MSTTVTMLTDGAALNFTGSKVRGDGYYNYNDGLHTIAIDVQDFKGRIYVQGTLSTNPAEADENTIIFDPWRTYPKANNVVYYGK